jgi:hypothetical protein
VLIGLNDQEFIPVVGKLLTRHMEAGINDKYAKFADSPEGQFNL